MVLDLWGRVAVMGTRWPLVLSPIFKLFLAAGPGLRVVFDVVFVFKQIPLLVAKLIRVHVVVSMVASVPSLLMIPYFLTLFYYFFLICAVSSHISMLYSLCSLIFSGLLFPIEVLIKTNLHLFFFLLSLF